MLLCGIKRKVLNNLVDYQGLLCDPAGTQTQDLQNRNLTLYSLSYGAFIAVQKYKKEQNLPNFSPLFSIIYLIRYLRRHITCVFFPVIRTGKLNSRQ